MRAREFIREAGEDLNKQLEKHYWSQYNPTDREMIGRYVSDNSYLNGMLYAKDADKHLKDPQNAYHTDAIKHLDKLAQQQTTPTDMTVHRGLRTAPQLGKGDVMTSPGFLSTSVDPDFAHSWSGKQALGRERQIRKNPQAYSGMTNPEYRHLMQIQVPKGTPGFYASDAQAEWVAPRGSQVKVDPKPVIDHETKTVKWQGQYVPTQPKPAATSPATTVSQSNKGVRGGGGGGGYGADIPPDIAAMYQLDSFGGGQLGADIDYPINLMKAEKAARALKK
jgi:hypothetical protein